MRALVTGARGQLGNVIARELCKWGIGVLEPTRDKLDLSQPILVKRYLEENRPALCINCAAIHDIAQCDDHPAMAYAVNVGGVTTLCEHIERVIHISTDMVLDSPPGLADEQSHVNGYNQYTKTKLDSERIVNLYGHTVVRVSALYGHYPCRGKNRPNFVDLIVQSIEAKKMIQLPNNVGCSPGYVDDVVKSLIDIVFSSSVPEIVHLSPKGLDGSFSWARFARMIANTYYGTDDYIEEFSRPNDPFGMVNMTTKYQWSLPPVEDALKRYGGRRHAQHNSGRIR